MIFPPAIARAAPLHGKPLGQQMLLLLAAAGAILFACGFGPNLDLAALSVVVLVAGCFLLWRPGESPVMAVTFCFHWLGASVATFHANWLNIDIFRYSDFGGEMREATALSLVGILCVAIGMRLGAGAWRPYDANLARKIALTHSLARWFYLYCGACLVSFFALSLAWLAPGLSQIVLAVTGLRWGFFFVLAYASFARGGMSGLYLPLAFCGEFAMSLGGYFSDFRTVFFFTIYAAFASGVKLSVRKQAGLAVLLAALVGLGIVWSGIKEDYRKFASEGRKEQVTTVDYATRLNKLAELTADLDEHAVDVGLDKMLHRLSYVEFFSAVLDFVPNQASYEGGALMWDAVTRPFLPRAFFPEKSAIDDTARTNFYTGGLAGLSEGTSISVGYISETYIDFGPYGMMVALLGIGCVYGFVYRLFSRSKHIGSLVGMGLASAVLATIGGLESSFTKVAGSFVACLIAAALFRFIVPFGLRWIALPNRVR